MPALLPLLWANRKLIAEIAGFLVLLALLWWFGFHNPAVIKKQDAQIAALQAEVKAAHGAISLLQDISSEHSQINQESNDNVIRIRVEKKPGRSGLFVAGGVLPAVYKGYSAAGAAPFALASSVRSGR